MKFKKVLTATVATLVVSLIAIPQGVVRSAVLEDEQWPSQFAAVAGLHAFELDEVSGLRDNVSVLIGSDANGQKLCTATTSSGCTSSAGYSFRAVLGPCTSSVTIDCIESVTATKTDGTSVTGTFKQFFPARGVNDFTGSPSEGVPGGGPPSLWTMTGLPHAFGSDYEVTVQLVGSKANGDALKPLRSFSANITPVDIYQTQCNPQFQGLCMDTFSEKTDSNGKTTIGFGGVAADVDEGIRCVNWGENAKCAMKHAFPAGVKFTLKVRLTTTPTGWLHGRLKDPTASITRADNVTTMTVSAESTKIPIVSGVGQWTSLPANIQEWFTANCPSNCGTRLGLSTNPLVRNAISGPTAFSEAAFSQLKLWSTYTQDKAVALPSQWSVRTLSYSEMVKAPSCIKDGAGVTGIVATNASAYAEGPPSFDEATKTLNYKVAAPHYEKDGTTEFKGRYDLVLRSDIAKCLYKLDESPVTSDVSVAGEDGTSKAATTSMTNADGWFKFTANGFTHSAPTVKVKLTQATPATVAPGVTTAPVSPVAVVAPFVKPVIGKGKSSSLSSVAKKYGLAIPAGAKVSISQSAASKKKCVVLGNKTVKGVAAGNCTFTVSVTPKATKKMPKPKTVKKSITITVK